MNMNTEPIRLPAIATAVLLVAGPPVVAILLGQPWQVAVAGAITGLVASGGVIARAESVRARTDSPATIQARWEQHATAAASDLADRVEQPAEVIADSIDLSTPPEPVDDIEITVVELAGRVAELERTSTRNTPPAV